MSRAVAILASCVLAVVGLMKLAEGTPLGGTPLPWLYFVAGVFEIVLATRTSSRVRGGAALAVASASGTLSSVQNCALHRKRELCSVASGMLPATSAGVCGFAGVEGAPWRPRAPPARLCARPWKPPTQQRMRRDGRTPSLPPVEEEGFAGTPQDSDARTSMIHTSILPTTRRVGAVGR